MNGALSLKHRLQESSITPFLLFPPALEVQTDSDAAEPGVSAGLWLGLVVCKEVCAKSHKGGTI